MKWQCTLLQRWLPEYPDGNLPVFWRGRLQAHLEHCADCRREAADLREVEEAIQAAPVTDPGAEFWSEFSREMHLKLVQAAQTGQMAPARSPWWGRIPYLVGAPALAGLLLWVAVSYLNPERPDVTPAPLVAKSGERAVLAPVAEMAKQKSISPPAEIAAAPSAPVQCAPEEPKNFVYVARNGGGGEEAPPDDEMDDLESTLSGMTEAEKEAFLRKLSQHDKDGSCITGYSAIFSA
jgi:hypothetical protein